ncbi:hypothetical protein LJR039_007418 [Pseudorhodoferax sp. LjRoot39]|uniref:hypothetical protein n=1 Tax=Pseudorhodoferax sp. LjRoot39 TaxID=3342328 RepID=UPI003ECD6E79
MSEAGILSPARIWVDHALREGKHHQFKYVVVTMCTGRAQGAAEPHRLSRRPVGFSQTGMV